MMVSAEQLKFEVEKRWPGAEIIEKTVVRFTKRSGDSDYAVYYLDVGEELPDGQEALADFQERVIGARYFEGRKSLQWNTYLYFVRDDADLKSPKTLALKGILEGDRAFARKRIVPSSRLEAIIEPPVVEVSDARPEVGLLSVWLPRLDGAGIRDAVMGDERLPQRMMRIEQASPKPVAEVPIKSSVRPAQGLSSLQLASYRPFPRRRDYDFGKVNLLFGPNGAGKTSLLEAIELFYCGKSHRNPKSNASYDIRAVLLDGTEERATSNRPLQELRDRNLDWYGQPEVNTTNLYQSFAQFNFLNTDAAVRLATTAADMETDLAKLLVGPDVSRVWENIRKLLEETSKEVKTLSEAYKQSSDELEAIDAILAVKSGEESLSSVLLQKLRSDLTSKGWIRVTLADRASLARLTEVVGQTEAAIARALGIGGLPAPLTVEAMQGCVVQARERLGQASSLMIRADTFPKRLAEKKARLDQLLALKEVLMSYALHAQLRTRRLGEESRALRQRLEELSDLLGGVDRSRFQSPGVSGSLNDWFEDACYAVVQKVAALDEAKRSAEQLQLALNQSQDLGQRLREVALQVIAGSGNQDECPICHTQFSPGELVAHMQRGVDEKLEASLRESRGVVAALESEFAELVSRKEHASEFVRFASRLKLDDVEVPQLSLKVASLFAEFDELQSRGTEITRRDAELRARGLTEEDLLAKEEWLSRQGVDLVALEASGVSAQVDQVEVDIQKVRTDMEAISTGLQDVCSQLSSVLETESSELAGLKQENARLVEWVVSVEAALSRLLSRDEDVSLPVSRSLSELMEELADLRAQAIAADELVRRELLVSEQREQAILRRQVVQERIANITSRGKAFRNAQKALKEIVEEHSLAGAVNQALDRNRRAIERIFAQIHAPDEFSGIGSQLGRLVRRVDKSEVTLSEISTGQRAAYALSLFLAQNAQLRDGPPVLLVDDPVAHVDDLNFLSLLDYLREVVVRGGRQVFFATASEKIASLFERKFDFLGNEGFRRFDIKRGAIQGP